MCSNKERSISHALLLFNNPFSFNGCVLKFLSKFCKNPFVKVALLITHFTDQKIL